MLSIHKIISSAFVLIYCVVFNTNAQNNAIFGGGNSGGFVCNCSNGSGSITPLPIELLTFKGYCDNNTILLEWTTASELNNDYFTIETCKNGFEWLTVGDVEGSGTFTGMLNYTYYTPTYGKSINYYRIKQTDYDGKYEYSPVISVLGCESNDFFDVNLYPNPTTGVIKFSAIKYPDNVTLIEIYNTSGIKIYESLTYQETIDISAFENGIYEVRISFGSVVKFQKIILSK